MILFSLMLACGPDEAAEPAMAPAAAITADDVLQRHVDVSKQCDLMVADNYLFEWDTVVTDKQTSAKAERVIQQGRQGLSFTRMHQVVKPVQRFSAFGLSTDKSWWSAGDLGVKKDLPESIAKGLMVHLDPTPICSYQARWKERTYKGEVDFQGQRAHQVIATWSDDTTIELWFNVSTGLLMGTRTQIGDQLSNTMSMTKYETHAGIQWPGEVISERVESSLKLAVAEKLRRLEVGNPSFRDVGPNEVAALLQAQSDAREKAAAEKK